MGENDAGWFLANRLDVPRNETAVNTTTDKLLPLVVPTYAGHLLGTVVSLLLLLQSQVPQTEGPVVKSNQKL